MDDQHDIKLQLTRWIYRTLCWGRDHVPPGARSVIGVLFMIGGVFGFLPVLGFWMLPLGMAFVALDVPPARAWLDRKIEALRVRARIEHRSPSPSGQSTSSQ